MKKTYCFLLVTLSAGIANAQTDTTKVKSLDEVVVTASKTDIKQSQTGKIVTVIDSKTIQNNAGHTLTELLNNQAGFMLVGANNTMGTNIENYFRGADAGNLLIVVDGVPVSDPSQISNTFDLNSIPLEQIDRIEILKGGQSTLWGSDAVAGVVQIFLKKPEGKPLNANGSFSYGTYNTLRAGGGVNGTVNKLSYKLQYNYQKSGGFSSAYDSTGSQGFDKDGFSQNNLQGELKYDFTDHFNVKLLGTLSDYHYDLDAGAFTDDKDYTGKNKNNFGAVYLNYHKDKLVWNTLASYQKANRYFTDDSTDRSSPYAYFSTGGYAARNITAESYVNYHFNASMQLVGGVQFLDQNTDQSYYSLGSFGPYSTKLGSDSAHNNQLSAYASYLITDLHGFNFEAGLRVNHHSIYGNNLTYTINPSYVVSERSRLFLNISSGYKIPSLYQLYSEYGNRDLKPESSVTYEFGLQTQTDETGSSFRIAAFKRDSRNLIIFYTDPNTFASYYINRDKQHDYGFEIESSTRLGKAATWNNNFAFVDGEGIEDGVKVKNLYRRPNFTVNSSLSITPVEHLTLTPSFKYVGDRPKGTYDIGPDPMPHYYTIGFFAAYQFPHVRLFADLQNLTNQQYFDVYGYNSKRFNMMAGVNLSL
ncbi:MAG TPA: TonB-dependent receptor [Puia sp.]|nr:TonB-dependent receptor [Puia sp.]